jgi:hypothetical protein
MTAHRAEPVRPVWETGQTGFGMDSREELNPREKLEPGAALVVRVLQMVSEPTLAVARTGQCADIERMTHVGLRWDTRHGIWDGTGRTVVI